ncbi:MAG: hypothetical protein QOH41_1059 [Blastocatellia bacterium]|nr:hypothetical protein [Blastocatellia bacterium]
MAVLLPTRVRKRLRIPASALGSRKSLSSFPQPAMRPLLIVGSIPIEALHQLTQSAILQQGGFGLLLNLAPGDASGQFLCHDAREFHFVIAAKRRHP